MYYHLICAKSSFRIMTRKIWNKLYIKTGLIDYVMILEKCMDCEKSDLNEKGVGISTTSDRENEWIEWKREPLLPILVSCQIGIGQENDDDYDEDSKLYVEYKKGILHFFLLKEKQFRILKHYHLSDCNNLYEPYHANH